MRRIRLIVDRILDILYPPKCPGCSDVIPLASEDAFCSECREKWESLKSERCPKCDQPIRECWCGVPSDHKSEIDGEFHLVNYGKGCSTVTKSLIYSIKQYYSKRVFKTLAKEMYDELYSRLDNKDIIITAVPRSPRSKRRFGHDQSVSIAKYFCEEYEFEYVDVLYHIGNAKQKRLSRSERSKNAVLSYKIKNGSSELLKGKNVILIDDVVTSGSTVVRCAHLLKSKGAKTVRVFCIAKTMRNY